MSLNDGMSACFAKEHLQEAAQHLVVKPESKEWLFNPCGRPMFAANIATLLPPTFGHLLTNLTIDREVNIIGISIPEVFLEGYFSV